MDTSKVMGRMFLETNRTTWANKGKEWKEWKNNFICAFKML